MNRIFIADHKHTDISVELYQKYHIPSSTLHKAAVWAKYLKQLWNKKERNQIGLLEKLNLSNDALVRYLKNKKYTTNYHMIPEIWLLRILIPYLNQIRTLLKLRRVNKFFRDLCSNDMLWQLHYSQKISHINLPLALIPEKAVLLGNEVVCKTRFANWLSSVAHEKRCRPCASSAKGSTKCFACSSTLDMYEKMTPPVKIVDITGKRPLNFKCDHRKHYAPLQHLIGQKLTLIKPDPENKNRYFEAFLLGMLEINICNTKTTLERRHVRIDHITKEIERIQEDIRENLSVQEEMIQWKGQVLAKQETRKRKREEIPEVVSTKKTKRSWCVLL